MSGLAVNRYMLQGSEITHVGNMRAVAALPFQWNCPIQSQLGIHIAVFIKLVEAS
jgi:hypothetical protein